MLENVHAKFLLNFQNLFDKNQIEVVAFDEFKVASARLRDMSYEERALHPCIGTDRADLVIAGCAILESIQSHCPTDRLYVADRGLRDGILIGLMADADHEADSVLEVL